MTAFKSPYLDLQGTMSAALCLLEQRRKDTITSIQGESFLFPIIVNYYTRFTLQTRCRCLQRL